MLKIDGFDISTYKRISVSGCASVYCFEANDKSYIAKVSTNEIATLEEKMLRYLKDNNLLVPNIIKRENNLLVTEFLANDGVIDTNVEVEIANQLINLHSISSEFYGFDYDTYIATATQYNTKTKDWIEFFANERIRKFAMDTYESGSIPLKLLTRLENFSLNFDKYLIQPQKPSLLHGDIWSGNIISFNNKLQAFIDPAIYFGHNEMELAFINMFDTLGDTFYKEYTNVISIEKEFKTREMIYNIYPNLVHVKAFGGFYVDNINRILKHFGY